ncbi:MAG: molybdate ABC transporter substrate-binding protein [Desulfonatronovibrionaceae bacterium]
MSFPLIPDDREGDVHNLEALPRSELTVFMAGNQFMVVPDLIQAFKEKHPEVGDIFYETLPPGLELRQILAGGARFRGVDHYIRADVYSSVSKKAMRELEAAGLIRKDDYFLYLYNRLALMVKKGNPKGISSVLDLARSDVVVSQPSTGLEHIADYILDMYRKAGGEALVGRVTREKVQEGTTLMTTVHHRETPERILEGKADVGPVWQTEIRAALNSGLDIQGVDVGPDLDQHEDINYYITRLKNGKNPKNAARFLEFIKSPRAASLFAACGFVPESF